MPSFQHLSVWRDGDLSVVRFKDHSILSSLVKEVGEELCAVAAEEACRKLLLNLSDVDFLFSDVLGRILAAHKIMKQKGGKLTLCEVRPPILEVLAATKLDTLLEVSSSEAGETKR